MAAETLAAWAQRSLLAIARHVVQAHRRASTQSWAGAKLASLAARLCARQRHKHRMRLGRFQSASACPASTRPSRPARASEWLRHEPSASFSSALWGARLGMRDEAAQRRHALESTKAR